MKMQPSLLYADAMLTESEYSREKLEIEAALSGLAVPSHEATFEAASYVSQVGALWGQMITARSGKRCGR